MRMRKESFPTGRIKRARAMVQYYEIHPIVHSGLCSIDSDAEEVYPNGGETLTGSPSDRSRDQSSDYAEEQSTGNQNRSRPKSR